MKIIHKILICIAFLIVCLIGNNSVFADDENTLSIYDDEFGITVSFPALDDLNRYSYAFVRKDNRSGGLWGYCLCLYNSRPYATDKTSYTQINVSGSHLSYFVEYNSNNNSFGSVQRSTDSGSSYFGVGPYQGMGGIYIIWSNFDICYGNTSNVFFQTPPPPVTPAPQQAQALLTSQQVEEVPKSLVQVLQIVLPVALVIMGIMIVIYLIRLVISRVS